MVFMPHWPVSTMRGNIKYDLERILIILEKLNNPHEFLAPVIHIAGTNGKGSTLAFLESIFYSAGYSVHKYTSPHFLNFNERIIINGQMIDDAYLYELMEKVRYVSEETNIVPTLFEASTVAAFLAFAENNADVVLLETGMGGRLDATNVLENPLLTIISSISYDHMEYLGPTLKLIAAEKAGIIKQKSKCVIADQTDEVREVLFDVCERKSTEYFAFGYDFSISKGKNNFIYHESGIDLALPIPSLPGDHQLLNASNAIAAIMRIRDIYSITDEHITRGLKMAKWRGRLEKLTSGGLKKAYSSFEFWLDGAHNEGGARMLKIWLEDNYKNREIFLIIGLTKGRDITNFISQFSSVAKVIFGVRVESEPSSYSLEALQDAALKLPDIKFQTSLSILDACDQIKLLTQSEEPLVLITGSLFLLSDVYKIMAR
jgi:dihydrofolate synthase/folylpolyglutamate synthase